MEKQLIEWVPVPSKVGHSGGYDATYTDSNAHSWLIHTRRKSNGKWRAIVSYDGTLGGASYWHAGNPLTTQAQHGFDSHELAAEAILSSMI